MNDSTTRFSSRVEAYTQFRPGYPSEIVSILLQRAKLDREASVADIGAGTGIFTGYLLDQGLRVFAVEPNSEMRKAAEASFTGHPNFTSVDASAESTGLEPASMDLITAAQAFHWFDNEASQKEFRRILKPAGQLALVWNKRQINEPFQQAYDAILREFAPEYDKVNHMRLDADRLAHYFMPGEMQIEHFDNRQQLTFAALIGRLQSSSYCPDQQSPQYIPLVTELLALFDQYARDGRVNFDYDTQLYLGPLAR